MLTVVHDSLSSNEDGGASRSLLDEIVRDGARQMLAAALAVEVAAYLTSSVISSTSAAGVWWCAMAITTSATC
jgi:hypothetical protein